MTAEERQTLRDAHIKWAAIDDDGELKWFCSKCNVEDFSCDVIKVLDELDQVANAAEIYGITVRALVERDNERTDGLVSPAQTDTCTHYGIDSGGADYYGTSNPPQEADWNYAYCPNCGEKL